MSKTDRLRENLKKTILQFIEGRRYEPIGETLLFKRLGIPAVHYIIGKQAIVELLSEGKLERIKKQLHIKKPSPGLTPGCLIGTLRTHPRGFGFVIPKDKITYPKDIFIPKNGMEDAVDGDEVEVDVLESSLTSEKGPEGQIIHIIKRGRSHLAGIIKDQRNKSHMEVFAPLLGITRPVLVPPMKEKSGSAIGDRVIVKIDKWGKQNAPIEGTIAHCLGNITDASIDIVAAIEEFGLCATFSKHALEEAELFGSRVKLSEYKKREDLRHLVTFTIDPTTAKDFDDALSLSKTNKGNFELGVHIADVAHYVQKNSALDEEAYKRCNSTYFPGKCVPMLPETLSNNLCSLKANVVRLTVSVLMTFNQKGDLQEHRIVRSMIKSKKRFTYEEAKKVIDGRKKSIHAETLHTMVELCLLLKQKRKERGSIDFALPETVMEINSKGEPTGFSITEYDISHQLVEEFMLKANEVVATTLAQRGFPLLFRTHEEPTDENREDFFALARSFGFYVPAIPSKQDLQKLFDEAKGTPFAYGLTVGFIRSMKLATYSPDNVGHYGLSLEHYCHFTSPIRRYSDLVTQRLLFGDVMKEEEMETISKKCSEQERISFRAEMSVRQLKKLRLMKKYYDEDRSQVYVATISKVKPFGLSFEVPPVAIEGFLHVSALANDFFVYDEKRGALVGRRTGTVYTAGKTLSVQLTDIDLIVQETKWSLKEPSHQTKKKKKR